MRRMLLAGMVCLGLFSLGMVGTAQPGEDTCHPVRGSPLGVDTSPGRSDREAPSISVGVAAATVGCTTASRGDTWSARTPSSTTDRSVGAAGTREEGYACQEKV